MLTIEDYYVTLFPVISFPISALFSWVSAAIFFGFCSVVFV